MFADNTARGLAGSIRDCLHPQLGSRQAADTFLLTAPTIASWMKRLDEEGPDALAQLRAPVNKFPDFVRYVVHGSKHSVQAWVKSRLPRRFAELDFIWERRQSAGFSRNRLSLINRRKTSPLAV